jgi:hypothetical protein
MIPKEIKELAQYDWKYLLQTPGAVGLVIEDILRSMLPEGWLEQQGAGIIAALSAVAERIVQAIQNLSDGLTPSLSYKGSYARGRIKITISRPGTLLAGTIFRDQHGEDLIVTEDCTFNTSGEFFVNVVSKRQSFQANLTAGTLLIPAFFPEPQGKIDPEPLTVDAIKKVVVYNNMVGGSTPALEELLEQRSISITPNEDITLSRWRFSQLSKVITPNVIREIIKNYFPEGKLIEFWEVAAFCDYSFCDWDRIFSFGINGFIVQLPREIDNDPDVVSKVAALWSDIDTKRAAGIYWFIEEV